MWFQIFVFLFSQICLASELSFEFSKGIFGAGELTTSCQYESRKFHCKIDSGAPMSLLPKVVAGSSFEVVNRVQYAGASGATMPCEFSQLKNMLSSKHMKFQNPAALICPVEDALLGLSQLNESSLLFNFNKNQLRFDQAPPKDLSLLDMYPTDFGYWIVDVQVRASRESEIHTLTALVDTGAGLTAVDYRVLQMHPELGFFLGGKKLNIEDTTGALVETAIGHLRLVNFGDAISGAPYVVFTDLKALSQGISPDRPIQMIIGANMLRELDILFIDPENQKLGAR